jgi:hypothetical protein
MLINIMDIASILLPFGTFYGHFGIFFPVLVCCTKKNLATLVTSLPADPRIDLVDDDEDVLAEVSLEAELRNGKVGRPHSGRAAQDGHQPHGQLRDDLVLESI